MPTVHARPYDFPFDPAHTAVVMIDMQRDFLEPGGFGAMLGNDVSLLRPIVPACVRLLALARAKGMAVIHTQEAHDAQLADCPPSKRARGTLSCATGAGLGARPEVEAGSAVASVATPIIQPASSSRVVASTLAAPVRRPRNGQGRIRNEAVS